MNTLGDVSLALTSSSGNRRLPLTVGERVPVRVVEVRADHVELEIKGLRVLAGPVEGVAEGDVFTTRVEALQPTVILKRLSVAEAGESEGRPTVSTGVAGSGAAALRWAEWVGHRLFLKGENTVEGRALSAIGFSLGLAHDGSAGEHTLARLFRFFGLDDGGAKGRIEQRVAGEPVARLLNRWLKAPAAEAAIDDLSRLREALASLKKSAESIVAANRILVAADQPMFLEWPLLGTSASPVRLLLSRDKKDAAPQGAPATRVEMSFETRSLGPVRVSLTLSGGLDAVIRMKEDALARMREEQAGLVEALGAVRRGATVRLAPLLDDEKALPDLSTLLTRAKGGLGRLHVTA